MNILNVEKVSKTFGEKVLLDKVTLGINKGDKVGVIGVNGTGKSTLLKIIAGIEEPDEGNVIKGRNVTVTYLAQSPDHAKDETVLSYVLRGKANASEAKAKEILNKLGIGAFDASMDMLSGGQKKRVALVNALLTPADIFEQKEENARLYEALASLPEKQRNRITSHFLLGMSLSDIAKSEGTGVSSVHEGIQRGLRRLKKILEKMNTDPENYHQK